MSRAHRELRTVNIWPGFVDALTSLVLAFIFVLLIFVVAQFTLSEVLTGRNEALRRLNRQVAELADMLNLERKANADLRLSVAQLSAELQSSVLKRDTLATRLSELSAERDKVNAQLAEANARGESSSEQAEKFRGQLESAVTQLKAEQSQLESAKGQLEVTQRQLETAQSQLDATQTQLAAVESRLASAESDLDATKKELASTGGQLAAAQTKLTATETKLAAAEGRLVSSDSALDATKKQLAATEGRLESAQKASDSGKAALDAEKKLSAEARQQVELLNRQILALRDQLASIQRALDASEAVNKTKDVQIADLGNRLNVALASKVEELARYRSEFFGRLREILGDRPDIRIVGDRFVFQSEVLFPSGSADLNPQGEQTLRRLAETLSAITPKIPAEIHWILEVDGYTDKRPIATPRFHSNWELSSERAIAVVRVLSASGIAPEHLSATGFGEYQPIDPTESEAAYAKNRRIELKLTQR